MPRTRMTIWMTEHRKDDGINIVRPNSIISKVPKKRDSPDKKATKMHLMISLSLDASVDTGPTPENKKMAELSDNADETAIKIAAL